MATMDIVKNAISNGMKELMREKAIDKISVNEICQKCSLNRRNFYRYFQDKYEVVDWIYYHDNLIRTEHYTGWSFWDYWPKIAQSMYEDPAFYRNAFQYTGQNSFREYCILHLYELLHPDYEDVFPSKKMEHFWVDHVCNASFDAFVLWLSEDPPMPAEEYAKKFEQAFVRISTIHIRLIERPNPVPDNPHQYNPAEPAKK